MWREEGIMTKRERENMQDISSIESRIEHCKKAVEELTVTINAESFTDQAVANGYALYKGILKSTVEILGEEAITEAVAIQLIETAGYGVWRGIMGSKNPNQNPNQFEPMARRI